MEQDFLDALSRAGIPPVSHLMLDGNLRRYNIQGDKKGRRNGWYRFVRLRPDFAYAVFGCNKRGISEKWSSKERQELTAYDKKVVKKKQEELQKAQEELQSRVAVKANDIWGRLRIPAAHAYATRKGVGLYGVREMYKSIAIPVYIDNYIVSLQFINQQGDKRFLTDGRKKGGYHIIGLQEGDDLAAGNKLYIAEGYATAASIFEATRVAVVIAFDAYNLPDVGMAIRQRWPLAQIVMAADNDQWTSGNPGISKAQETADKIGASILFPHFDYDDKSRPTDWNDYHRKHGLIALRDTLSGIARPAESGAVVTGREWRTVLIEGKQELPGYPLFDAKSKENAYLFLENHEFFREMIAYNTFSSRLVLTRQPPWDSGEFRPRAVENRDCFNATRWLERIGIRTNKEVVEDSFEAIGETRRVNPPRDYLEALQWDGIPRLDRWLTYYLGAEKQNPDYLALVGSKWFMGAVSRIYVPGMKFDNVLILEGGQDMKKSMIFEKITTFREAAYFLEFSGDVHHKDSLGMMQGRIIVEMSELATMRRTVSEDMKTFVTRKIDTFRPAWGKKILERERRFVLAATTNNDSGDGYLVDPTGNRRYWPIGCGTFDIDALERDKDQLWAEAVARWKAGERTWLESDEEKELARFEQAERQYEDAWLMPIQSYLVDKTETDVYKICKDALFLNTEQVKRVNEDRVRNCLRKLGWERSKIRPRTEEGRITIWMRKS